LIKGKERKGKEKKIFLIIFMLRKKMARSASKIKEQDFMGEGHLFSCEALNIKN